MLLRKELKNILLQKKLIKQKQILEYKSKEQNYSNYSF